jgi:hypothetical protein
MYKIIGADQQEYGPVSAEQIRQWITEGRLSSQSLLQMEGETNFRPLTSFPEFASMVQAPAPIAPLAMPAQAPKTNTMALTAMIMGILSVVLVWCCYGIPFNLCALIFGIIGMVQIKNSPVPQKGKGMAIAGIVLAIVSFIMAAAFVAFVVSNPDFLQKFGVKGLNKF